MIQRTFDPALSITSLKIMNLSDKEIFARYFIKNDNASLFDDFKREINSKNNEGQPLYPETFNFNSKKIKVNPEGKPLNNQHAPLSVICSIIDKESCNEIPVEYKLNSKALLEDLENILIENPDVNLDNYPNQKLNAFTVQLSLFLVEKINLGIDYIKSLTI